LILIAKTGLAGSSGCVIRIRSRLNNPRGGMTHQSNCQKNRQENRIMISRTMISRTMTSPTTIGRRVAGTTNTTGTAGRTGTTDTTTITIMEDRTGTKGSVDRTDMMDLIGRAARKELTTARTATIRTDRAGRRQAAVKTRLPAATRAGEEIATVTTIGITAGAEKETGTETVGGTTIADWLFDGLLFRQADILSKMIVSGRYPLIEFGKAGHDL